MSKDTQPKIIGRAEKIDIVDLGILCVPAKIDTGADSSSIWTSYIKETSAGLECVFFGKESPFYSGLVVRIPTGYKITRVANSFGHKELRYKVKLRIRVNGKLIRATFTLSDRSKKTYPILLGRRLLKGKFVVDVSQGDALDDVEKLKAENLKKDLEKLDKQKEKP
jgi:hypothetical protein